MANVGRRTFLGGLAAGVVTIVSGGRLLPRFDAAIGGGWRIYNVAGFIPSAARFELVVDGMVEAPYSMDLAQLRELPRHAQVSDFECVTGWRVRDVRWQGTSIETLLQRARPHSGATHVTFYSRDGVYVDSLSMRDALRPDTMMALDKDDAALPLHHGGPARLVAPSMYGYKSVKWLGRIEVTDREVEGYWEARGYRRDATIDRDGEVYDGRRVELARMKLSVEVPPNWSALPAPATAASAITFRPPAAEGRVEASLVTLDHRGRATRGETQALLAGLERAGLTNPIYGAMDAQGMAGDSLQADDGTGQRFFFAFFPDGQRILQAQAQAPVSTWQRWEPTFLQLLGSLRRR
ncbi:MAG TPA: molybdopterin-dependent oxidoreductase [Acidimicrobiales bacterium]|nr:molybdopterin-dependent oxidoreductase [Acidimicrobiales bacterium]